MKQIEKLLQKHSSWERITQEEYDHQKSVMPESDFKFWYAIGPADKMPYKKALPDKEEMMLFMIDKLHESTNVIKGWVIAFGIMTIISVIAALITAAAWA